MKPEVNNELKLTKVVMLPHEYSETEKTLGKFCNINLKHHGFVLNCQSITGLRV